MMDNDSKLRQGKKKIFKDQGYLINTKSSKLKSQQPNPNKLKPQFSIDNKSSLLNKPEIECPIKIEQYSLKHPILQQLKRQNTQLSTLLTNLKLQLKQQHSRYDKLFQEYEQLIQKNNLIERQYIKLKYQHNKQLKNYQHSYKQAINHLGNHCEELFKQFVQSSSQVFNYGQEVGKIKIGELRENIMALVLQISKNPLASKQNQSSNFSNLNEMLRRKKSVEQFQLNKDRGQNKVQNKNVSDKINQEKGLFEKIIGSPAKQKDRGVGEQVKVHAGHEIVLEDEYYGQLQDYEFYEEKIMVRKNYELMRANRSSQNNMDIRRKKIFNLNSQALT